MNLTSQTATDNIVVDSISKLTLNLKGSSIKGSINNANAGEVYLTLDGSSMLTLTGDSYVKSLTNTDTTNGNINFNGYKLYVNGVAL